ncbi:MAG: hypothetical protein MUF05_00975 [Candidatus Omnitrophica bacterium]|nr:hypothetical protein [Candidatus Omnitrophota bacterium]
MRHKIHNMKAFLVFLSAINIFIIAFAQTKEINYNSAEESRDPFIPLVDNNGNLRKEFKRPVDEASIPKVNLMGISDLSGTFYAIIDGEMVKEADTIKELKIEKIYFDRVIVSYADKIFELKWEQEKNAGKK